MKKILVCFACGCMNLFYSHAQSTHSQLGISIVGNIASQTFYNPEASEDGRTQYNAMLLPGIGVFYQHPFKNNFGLYAGLSYQQKGSWEPTQYGSIFFPGVIQDLRLQNKFDYLSLDMNVTWHFIKSNIVSPFLLAGVQGSVLIKEKVESDIYPNNDTWPMEYFRDFKKAGVSYLAGVGLTINNTMSFAFKFNRDITPVVNKSNLVVRNWIWQMETSISLCALKRK